MGNLWYSIRIAVTVKRNISRTYGILERMIDSNILDRFERDQSVTAGNALQRRLLRPSLKWSCSAPMFPPRAVTGLSSPRPSTHPARPTTPRAPHHTMSSDDSCPESPPGRATRGMIASGERRLAKRANVHGCGFNFNPRDDFLQRSVWLDKAKEKRAEQAEWEKGQAEAERHNASVQRTYMREQREAREHAQNRSARSVRQASARERRDGPAAAPPRGRAAARARPAARAGSAPARARAAARGRGRASGRGRAASAPALGPHHAAWRVPRGIAVDSLRSAAYALTLGAHGTAARLVCGESRLPVTTAGQRLAARLHSEADWMMHRADSSEGSDYSDGVRPVAI